MHRYVVSRILQGIIALLLASIVIFGLARMTGSPLYLMLPDSATAEDYEALAEHLGLDKSLPEQYWIFISQAARGDFGNSLRYRAPVMGFILARIPATIMLTALGMLFSLLIAVPAGVVSAEKRDRWEDTLAKGFAILGQSLPTFWLGIVLIQLLAVQLGLLPAGGYGGITYWFLPAFTLGWHGTAGVLRLTRSAMLDTLSSDFVRLARIKGVPERKVIWKHALRNALLPVVTFGSRLYVHWLTGTVVVETVFAWPGVGLLSYQAVKYRDFPMMQGVLLIFVGLFVFANLGTDILYCYLDPRVRYVKK